MKTLSNTCIFGHRTNTALICDLDILSGYHINVNFMPLRGLLIHDSIVLQWVISSSVLVLVLVLKFRLPF